MLNKIDKAITYIKYKENFNQEDFNKLKLEEKIAFISKIIENKTNKTLYKSQLEASYYLYKNMAINMETGEGKSLASIIPLVLHTLEKKEMSFFLSINDMLLERDMKEFKNIYDYFNINIIKHFEKIDKDKKNICFTTGNHLISNYLASYININYFLDFNKDKSFVLIDEADMVLIDNAIYPVVLNTKKPLDIKHLEKIYNFSKNLDNSSYIEIDNGYQIKEEIIPLIEKEFKKYDLSILIYTIENCLFVLNKYKKNIDYIIEDKEIYHINEKTGLKERLETKDYTKHFISLKENLELKKFESVIIQKISIQSFFKSLKNKAAMSGTTLHEQKYFEFYGFIIKSIKSNFKSQRIVSPTKIYYNLKQKIIALLKDIDNIYKKYPRPILITTNNIQSAELLYNILTDYYENQSITFNLITAKNIDEDYLKIQEIGIKNHITISTQIAGRGIDIPIEKEVEETGGLHVMLFEVNNGFRIDEQLIGRTGRQGKKGSVQFYYALDDPLLIHYLNKKLKNIFLSLNLKEEDIIENKLIAKQIKKTQAEQEQIEYSMFERIALFDLTLDEARNSIFNLINENKNCKNYNELFVKILKNVLVLEAKDNLVLLKSIGLIFDDVDETNYFKKEDIILQNISNFFIAKLDEKDSKSIIHNQIIMWYIQFLKGTDSVQDGIFWRTKANKDPLVEFKKEVFNLYRNMLKNIRLSILQKTMATISEIEMKLEEKGKNNGIN